jgi:hypothetical protein
MACAFLRSFSGIFCILLARFNLPVQLKQSVMHPIIRNILAILAGIALGSAVNMGIIMLSSSIIPPPEGADVTTAEGLKAAMPLFQPKHFLMPFLAHALGTLAGAALAARLAASYQQAIALSIGAFFLLGGIAAVFMVPAPLWFIVLDLVLAYLPMAYLGWRWAGRVVPAV